YIPVGLEVSPQGDRVALLVTGMMREPTSISGRQLYQLSDFHGAEVRIYNLDSGQLMWTSTFDGVRAGGVAWSPDGLRLAVTLLSGNRVSVPIRWDMDNLLVIDSSSGTKLL